MVVQRRLTFLAMSSVLVIASTVPAKAADDPYRITETEMAACKGDAMSLCADTYPDERRLMACMKANIASLSAPCLTVFKAGLKRRGL